jgi:hypothetical protein
MQYALRTAFFLVTLLVLVACSEGMPTSTLEPSLSTPTPSSLTLTARVGETVAASFTFSNDEGTTTTYTATEATSWLSIMSGASGTLSNGQTATVGIQATCSTTLNQTRNITLSSTNDTKTVPVTLKCLTAFNIKLVFGSSISESQKQVFQDAARRWSQVLIGDIPNTTLTKASGLCGAGEPAYNSAVDDVVIYASVEPIDGAGNILGSAGPCLLRSSYLPIYGIMFFDSADVASLETWGSFDEVILHEMGHVLGFGTVWSGKSLTNYAPTTQSCSNTSSFTTQPTFTGSNAKLEYGVLGGSGNVPIENQYGAGTKCGHWDEELFDHEMMTGFLGGSSSGAVPLSRLTVASLQDLGYQVNKNRADSYSIPSCSPACLRTQSVGIDMSTREIILSPIGMVTKTGEVQPFSTGAAKE